MMKKKKAGPTIEVGLSLGDVVETLGLKETLDKILAMVQQGKLEVKIEIGKKKGKIPASITVRLKQAEK